MFLFTDAFLLFSHSFYLSYFVFFYSVVWKDRHLGIKNVFERNTTKSVQPLQWNNPPPRIKNTNKQEIPSQEKNSIYFVCFCYLHILKICFVFMRFFPSAISADTAKKKNGNISLRDRNLWNKSFKTKKENIMKRIKMAMRNDRGNQLDYLVGKTSKHNKL